MDGVYITTDPPSDLSYGSDGHVRYANLYAEVIYDEQENIAVEGWQRKLADFVKDWELDIVHNGLPLHGFVYWLSEEGCLTYDDSEEQIAREYDSQDHGQDA